MGSTPTSPTTLLIVLGLHFETHDSGAALVRDGDLVAAVNEERLSRKKHDKGPPIRSIAACLELGGVGPSDVDIVAVSGHGPPKAWYRYVTWEIHRAIGLHGGLFPFKRSPWNWLGFRRLRRVRGKRRATMAALDGFSGEFVRFPHEHLHVAGAYWTSGMTDPVIIVAEGSGWDRTTSVAVREGEGWRDIAHTNWPHSPGEFYDAVTALLGFRAPWHAGKITGLAAYGDPRACIEHVRPLLRHDNLRLSMDRRIFRWQQRGSFPDEIARHSREDIAAAFQLRLEEVMLELVAAAVKRTGKRQVALAGGTFANVKVNQKILQLEGVDEIFIHPGMSDIGIATGAALEAHANATPGFLPFRLHDVYLGPQYTDVTDAIKDFDYERPDDMEEAVAQKLADGKLVARYAGRMEYGPRALGNRSILYAPTDANVNTWLNEQLNRTEFMPFAPAVREENMARLFTGYKGSEYAAEFMTMAYDCTDFAKESSPAMVHIDGTARPQMVRKEVNPGYYRILELFEKKTGVPCLINTSFNMHEEPIVCTPADAVDGFLRSRIDYLAIEDCLVPLPKELRVAGRGKEPW